MDTLYFVFVYCKRSKTGTGEGLGTRLNKRVSLLHSIQKNRRMMSADPPGIMFVLPTMDKYIMVILTALCAGELPDEKLKIGA